MFAFVISGITCVYLLLTSFIVLLKNPKKKVNISLAVTLTLVGLWLIGITGLTTKIGTNIVYGRFIYATAILGMETIYLFVYYIAMSINPDIKRTLRPIGSMLITAGIVAITFTGFIVKSLQIKPSGQLPSPVFGPLYPLLLMWLLFMALSLTYLLIRTYKMSTGTQRSQVQTILFGLLVFVTIGIMTNVVLPQIFKTTVTAKFTPFTAAILASILSYAVVKQKFLDIRLVIARYFGYILSLTTLGALYSIITFLFVNKVLFKASNLTNTQSVAFTVAAIFLVFTFQPIKRFFDRLSNSIFYRDAYDPEQLFRQLNKVLVSSIDLQFLLGQSSVVITDNLKAEYCVFELNSKQKGRIRIMGTSQRVMKDEDVLKHLLAKYPDRVVVADDLSAHYKELRSVLEKDDIGILVSLSPSLHKTEENLGYIMLGPKKSGNPYSSQDIRVLDTVAGEMIIAIQNALHFEEIQNFNVTLQEKIEKATYQLRKANERLKALDESKDDFISMASHQLRTPLTSVKGYVSMVIDGDAGKVTNQQKKLLEQAFTSSQRMVNLIADLLNVSRLKTGKFVIDATATNLADMIKEEIAQLKEAAKAHNLELNYKAPEHFPSLMLDETKTRQVIMNFIDNAVYYTPAGGHITVELHDKPSSIELTVSDDGIGVPKAEQHHLFSKFYRAGNARKARPDGTGLGLFMAKKVVVAEGGAIIFTSTEGKGSTFGFTFPKAALQPKPPTKAPQNT